MTKQGPGLDYEPSADALTGFRSLMPPPPPRKPSTLGRIVKAPFKVVALPFKAVAKILGAPLRLFGRSAKTQSDKA